MKTAQYRRVEEAVHKWYVQQLAAGVMFVELHSTAKQQSSQRQNLEQVIVDCHFCKHDGLINIQTCGKASNALSVSSTICVHQTIYIFSATYLYFSHTICGVAAGVLHLWLITEVTLHK